MTDALIGYTGFVGGALLRQRGFLDLYNSKNIEAIAGRRYDLLICAGARAEKWLANQEPERDRASLERLTGCLGSCTAARVVLISTIDVYPVAVGVDETSPIDPVRAAPYGRHRYLLERFVAERFPRSLVVRLPALFGKGLKKNFIYDLLHDNCLDWTHRDSRFQFYDIERLWADCGLALEKGLDLVNLATEPVRAGDVSERCFGTLFENVTDKPPVSYDMRTRHAGLFRRSGPYMMTADECFAAIGRYVRDFREGRA